MKAIMRQYGASLVAAVIGVFLFVMIYELPLWGENGICARIMQAETVTSQEDGAALENYWRSK
jgi:hypothetical protein